MEIFKIMEKQYQLYKKTEETDYKSQFEWINGKFIVMDEEPCGWSVIKFCPENDSEFPSEISTIEQFTTEFKQILIQIERKIFRVKNFIQSNRIKPIIQDDYTLARYKSTILEFPDDLQRFWQNYTLVNETRNNEENFIEDNMKIPRFRLKTINVIRGVPGSGKSTFCKELCKQHTSEKILYTAPNHMQVSNFAFKLINENIRFTVLSEEARLHKDLRKHHNSNQPEFDHKNKNQILESAKLTLSTCTKPIKNLRAAGITILIIDEATRTTVLDAVTLIRKMPTLKVIIMCGDDRQLGARIGNNKVRDIFRYASRHGVSKYFLPIQYRFGQGTNTVISKIFYDNKMRNKRQDKDSEIHIVLIKDCVCQSQIGCENEVDAIIRLLSVFNQKESIGIISPYHDQLGRLEKAIPKWKSAMTTIDSCQGAEYEYVLISIGRHKDLGFIDRARLNVALTRARKGTVLIMNENVMRKSKELTEIYKKVESKDLVTNFVNQSMVHKVVTGTP